MNRKLSTMFFALSTMAFAVGIVAVPEVNGTTISIKVVTRAVTAVADVTAPSEVAATNSKTVTSRVAARDLEVDEKVDHVVVFRIVDVRNSVASVERVVGVVDLLNRVHRDDQFGDVSDVNVGRVLGGSVPDAKAEELVKVNVVGDADEVAQVQAHVDERVVGLLNVATNVFVNNGVDIVGEDVGASIGAQSCFVLRGGLKDRLVSRNDNGLDLVSASYIANGTRVAGFERRTGTSSKKSKPASRWDAQAQWDMRTRMARYGQNWSPVDETFRTNVKWSAKWELRWWGFKQNNGDTVWVYHRRSRTNGVRYTSVVDTKTGQWDDWKSVR